MIDKKRQEAPARQTQHMESLGLLACGIAHNFNNILMGISGYASLLQQELASGQRSGNDKTDRYIRQILDSVEKAKKLTVDLRTFGGKRAMIQSVISLKTLLMDMHRVLQAAAGEGIEVTLACGDDEGPVCVDPDHIKEAILHLTTNAKVAMPGGGRMTIATQAAALDEDVAVMYGVKPGRYVALSIGDTGEGMEEEQTLRSFEPFFMTQARQQGAGFGLSIAYGIVRQQGGCISVSSAKGAGTTFTIYLPVHCPSTGDEHRHHT